MKKMIHGVMLGATLSLLAPFAHAQETVFPIMCWTYYPFESALDLDYTIDNWVKLGITHPLAPSISSTTDKAQFRRFLDKCQKAGLKMFLTDKRVGPGAVQRVMVDGKDEAAYREACRAVRADWNDHPAVAGYYLFDEPYTNQLEGVLRAAKIMGEEMPDKQPFLNHHPWYNQSRATSLTNMYGTSVMREFLMRAVEKTGLKAMGYDYYRQQAPGTNGYDTCFYNLREWSEFSQATGVKWNVTMLCTEHYNYLVNSDIAFRWQLSVGAAMGASAITWFYPDHHSDGHGNYRNAPINQLGERTQTFNWMSHENRIFQHQYGSLFATLKWQGASMAGGATTFGGVPRFTPDERGITAIRVNPESDLPILVSNFTDEKGGRYVVLVNLRKDVEGSRKIYFDIPVSIKPLWKQWDHWKTMEPVEWAKPKPTASGEKQNSYTFYMAPGQLAFIRLAAK